MAYSLIDQESGAVPLTPLSKTELAGWRDTAPAHERDWAEAVGFKAESGKMALLPDKHGKLGRVRTDF